MRLNVPSVFAFTDVTSAFAVSYRPTVTGLPAKTFPVTVPVVGTGVDVGVDVDVGVAVATEVEVGVAI